MAVVELVAASMHSAYEPVHSDESGRPRRLAEFLKRSRLAIPVDSTTVGRFVRDKNRIGKIVSQEEFAEAIGVSRAWYGLLETGRVQASIALIDRICDALTLDEQRRITLIALALPAFSQLIFKAITTPP